MKESFWNLHLSWINDNIVARTRTCSKCIGGRNQKRGANDYKNISLESGVHGKRHIGNRFTKPNDIRTKLTTVFSFVTKSNVVVKRPDFYTIYILFVRRRANFSQFPVKMNNMRRACPLMEVIHVLGENSNVVPLLELCQQFVSFVRLDVKQLTATGVIEVKHCLWIFIPALNAGQLQSIMLFPQSILVTECIDATLLTYPCS